MPCFDCGRDVITYKLELGGHTGVQDVCGPCIKSRIVQHRGGNVNWWSHNVRGRMEKLIVQRGTPLNQSAFGVCGFACALYVLLRQRSCRAMPLFEATFADLFPAFQYPRFKTACHGPKDIHFVDVIMGRWRNVTTAVGHDAFVDFCLCQALANLLKQIDPAKYNREKDEFSALFVDPSQGWSTADEILAQGNFALRTYTLTFIMENILGAKINKIMRQGGRNAWVDKSMTVSGLRRTTIFTTPEQLVQELTNKIAAGNFVLLAIWADMMGGLAYQDPAGYTVTRKSEDRRNDTGGLPFGHWVVVNACRQITVGTDKKAVLTVWTWGGEGTVTISFKHILSYVQDAILGTLS